MLTLIKEENLCWRDVQNAGPLEEGTNADGRFFQARDLLLSRLGRQCIDLKSAEVKRKYRQTYAGLHGVRGHKNGG